MIYVYGKIDNHVTLSLFLPDNNEERKMKQVEGCTNVIVARIEVIQFWW